MSHVPVKTLALFERRFDGDDCLLELARRRFAATGIGAEIHAATPEQLNWLMGFRPRPDCPVVVHLPRDFDLLQPNTRDRIAAMAAAGAGKVIGLVLHDQKTVVEHRAEYQAAARHVQRQLETIPSCPLLFIEYAVGLAPNEFVGLFGSLRELALIAPCIDIGHVGVRAARQEYARRHPGRDVCSLKHQGPELPKLMPDVQASIVTGVKTVIDLLPAIGELNKPVHFHLHDGHPLSNFSPFGVADHLSFFAEIPLNFEYCGRRAVPTMFGPAGLRKVIDLALTHMDATRLSLTLEIHPTCERLEMGDAAPLFSHWTDKTNAERTNHWLSVLTRNHSLLVETIADAQKSAETQPG